MPASTLDQPSEPLPTRMIAKAFVILGSFFFLPLFIVSLTELRWLDEQEVEAVVVSAPRDYKVMCRVPSHPALGSREVHVGDRVRGIDIGDSIQLWYSPTHPDRLRYNYLRGKRLSTPVRVSLTSGLALLFFFVIVAAILTLRRTGSPPTPTTPGPSA